MSETTTTTTQTQEDFDHPRGFSKAALLLLERGTHSEAHERDAENCRLTRNVLRLFLNGEPEPPMPPSVPLSGSDLMRAAAALLTEVRNEDPAAGYCLSLAALLRADAQRRPGSKY